MGSAGDPPSLGTVKNWRDPFREFPPRVSARRRQKRGSGARGCVVCVGRVWRQCLRFTIRFESSARVCCESPARPTRLRSNVNAHAGPIARRSPKSSGLIFFKLIHYKHLSNAHSRRPVPSPASKLCKVYTSSEKLSSSGSPPAVNRLAVIARKTSTNSSNSWSSPWQKTV